MICVLLITVFSSNLANVAGAYATTVALSNFTIYNIRFSIFVYVSEWNNSPDKWLWHRLLHKGRRFCALSYFTFLKRSSGKDAGLKMTRNLVLKLGRNVFTAKRCHLFSGSSGRGTGFHDPTKCVLPPPWLPRARSKPSSHTWRQPEDTAA